jgi:hypothetical protein
MSTSLSHPENYDDLKLIHGIGPGIENRLFNAHIQTYAQLSALTPHDLAKVLQGLAGLTAGRITERDWIGQARQLAAQQVVERTEHAEGKGEVSSGLASPEDSPEGNLPMEIESMAPESRKHYDNFTVELWLDKDNTVSRTRVLHVQEHNESAWNGWNGQKLIDFIEEHAGLHGVEPDEIHLQPALAAAIEPAAIGLVGGRPIPGMAIQGSQFTVNKMEVITSNNPSPGHILSSGQPFDLHLKLELSQVEASPGTLLDYSAKVYAKDLSRGTHLMIGAEQGELMYAKQASIKIAGNSLSAGPYRLEASVTLRLHNEAASATQQMAFLDGGVFQVY